MRWDDGSAEAGIRFSASADVVEGYGGRGVDGMAFRSRAGYLFRDEAGGAWWVIFEPLPGSGLHGDQVLGDVLACSASHEESIQIRVLASGVRRGDAEAAFRQRAPLRYEEAGETARLIIHRIP